ncbi:MAG: hypothetical protein ACRCZS_07040 [Chroococcidiopsis sp.]
MGCDIHCHAEVKIDGVWNHYNEINIERNYDLFGYLAGVRGDKNQAFPVRGLPNDASNLTRCESDWLDIDGHTHSWISIDEIAQVINQFHKGLEKSMKNSYLFGNKYEFFREYREDYPDFVEDVRWVFWFDN